MKSSTRKLIHPTFLTASFLILVSLTSLIPFSGVTRALSGSEFKPGRIIDDSIFYNKNAMSTTQIQQFLDDQMPSCDSDGSEMYSATLTRAQYGAARGYPAPYTCLKNYSVSVPAVINSGSDLCQGSVSSGTKTAAKIIYDVAQACGINPRVLLVLLQKEQGLITDEWPWSSQYRIATGYGCPDTAPCDEEFFGFFNQVYQAAKAYKRYAANPDSFSYKAKRNNRIYFNPGPCKIRNSSGTCTEFYGRFKSSPDIEYCGSTTVYIENQATASLYIYTPYQPNKSALDNLSGSGDACSAYGNRNFWKYYNDWFGSPIIVVNIIPVIYDQNTDISGETAKIGYRLNSKPTSTVSFDVYTSTSNSTIMTGSVVKILPENWDKPERNIVVLKGKNNPYLNGSQTIYLNTGSLNSADLRFNTGSVYTPDTPILHGNGSNEVYRLYNSTLYTHIFTTSSPERASLIADGWRDEGVGFYSCAAGNITYARLKNNSDYKLAQYGSSTYNQLLARGYVFEKLLMVGSTLGKKGLYVKYNSVNEATLYSVSSSEGLTSGYINENIIRVCHDNITPVYRLYNSVGKDHFYTKSQGERNTSIEIQKFNYEGVGFYITSAGTNSVFRLYSSAAKNHFYTTSITEKNNAVLNGYRFEGVGFNVNSSDTTDTFRLYSSAAKNHFYTTSITEKNNAVLNGYRYEGIGFSSY